jgi:hypothetical protein
VRGLSQNLFAKFKEPRARPRYSLIGGVPMLRTAARLALVMFISGALSSIAAGSAYEAKVLMQNYVVQGA